MPRNLLLENNKSTPRNLLLKSNESAPASYEEGEAEPKIPFWAQYSSPSIGFGKDLLYGLGNVATGLAQGVQGLRNLPYHLTNAINPALAQKLSQGMIGSRLFAPDTTNLSLFEPGAIGELTRTLASVVPGAMIPGGLGMTGKAASIAGGALGSAATAGESPFLGAAIGGSAATIAPYLMAGALKGGKYLAEALKKELSNIPKGFKVGEYEKIPEITMEKIRNSLSMEGVEKIKEPVKQLYDKVFKGFEEYNIPYAKTTKKLYSLHDLVTKPSLAEKEVSFFNIRPDKALMSDSDISFAVNKVHESPTLNNLHNARKVISDEAIKLEKTAAKKSGYLETAERNKLNYLNKAKNIIDSDIERFAEIVNPKASGLFKEANKQWALDVAPYKAAQNTLWSIPDEAAPEKFVQAFTRKFGSEKARNLNRLPKDITDQVKLLSKQLEDLEIARSMRKKLLYGGGALLGGSYGLDKIKNIIGGF